MSVIGGTFKVVQIPYKKVWHPNVAKEPMIHLNPIGILVVTKINLEPWFEPSNRQDKLESDGPSLVIHFGNVLENYANVDIKGPFRQLSHRIAFRHANVLAKHGALFLMTLILEILLSSNKVNYDYHSNH